MAIEILCTCGKKLLAKDEYAGKKAKCPVCGSILMLPPAADTNSLVMPVPVAPPPVAPLPVAPIAALPMTSPAAYTGEGAVTCPHCQAGNYPGTAWCSACGKALPLPSDTGPRIVGGEFATTGVGQTLQANELAKAARSASNTVIVIGILNIVLGGLVLAAFVNAPGGLSAISRLSPVVLALDLAPVVVGGLFLGLGVWAKFNPVPATISALALYILVTVLYLVAQTSGKLGATTIPTTVIFRIVFIAYLARAVNAGLKHRKLLAQGATNMMDPGAAA